MSTFIKSIFDEPQRFMTDDEYLFLSSISDDESILGLTKDRLELEQDMLAFKEACSLLEQSRSIQMNDPCATQRLNCIRQEIDNRFKRYRRGDEEEDASVTEAIIAVTDRIIKKVSEYLKRSFSHLNTLFHRQEKKIEKVNSIARSITDFNDGADIVFNKKMSILTHDSGRRIIDVASMLEALSLSRKTVELVHDVESDDPIKLFEELIDGKHLSGMFNTIVGTDARLANKQYRLGAHANADKYAMVHFDQVNFSGSSSIRTEKLIDKPGKESNCSQRDIVRLTDSCLLACNELQATRLDKFAEKISRSLEKHVAGVKTQRVRDITPIIRALTSLIETCCAYQYYLISHTAEYAARCLMAGRKNN